MKLTRHQEKRLGDLASLVKKSNLSPIIFVSIGLAKFGIKSNFTLERVKKDKLPAIYKLLDKANLFYRFSTKSGVNKVIVGTSKKELNEIYSLESRIFSANESSEEVYKYGRLMGYPKCCSKAMAEGRIGEDMVNNPGYHYMTQSPWPWPLSFLEPLVWHIPCSSDCSKSIKIGQSNSFLRKKFFPNYKSSDLLEIYDLWVLHFRDNLNLFFKGIKDGHSIRVKKIFYKNINPHTERTNLGENLEEAVQLIKDIEVNDTLFIDDKVIQLDNEKIYKKEDISDGCLIKFTLQ